MIPAPTPMTASTPTTIRPALGKSVRLDEPDDPLSPSLLDPFCQKKQTIAKMKYRLVITLNSTAVSFGLFLIEP